MIKKGLIFLLLFTAGLHTIAQSKFELQDDYQDKIRFKLINNLIVVPVEINGVELSFLLDTGVSKPIIFNFLNLTDELKINQTERIYLRGLGEGESIAALRSKNNIFKIGDAINLNQDLYAIFDPSLNFAPQLGVPIHGIIGYDFFKDFVVEINYTSKNMVIHSPEFYQEKACKKCRVFDLQFFNNKPYMDVDVVINQAKIPVKLLIDMGGSDALWLFEDDTKGVSVPEKYFDDFLGRGLSGSVYGKRTKVDALMFRDLELKHVNAAFPDSTSISLARNFKARNGSLGGEVLKRFNIVLDYPNSKISLKKNRNFNAAFYYNKSGIVLEHDGVRVIKQLDRSGGSNHSRDKKLSDKFTLVLSGTYKYVLAPAFTIVELRKNSPAKEVGLKLGDIILAVNNKRVHEYSLSEVTQLFYAEDGKRIKLLVDRDGVKMKFQFQLKNLL